MSIISSDTFVRANQSGLGTASDAETWAVYKGGATWSIVSNKGQNTGATTIQAQLIGSTVIADCAVKARISCTALPTNINCIARVSTSANTYYFAGMKSAGDLIVGKFVAGTLTNIQTATFGAVANTNYWIQLQCQGTTISAWIWLDGSSQPSPQISLTDSSIASGQFGIRSNMQLTTDKSFFDSFSVDNLVVPSINARIVVGDSMAPAYLPLVYG